MPGELKTRRRRRGGRGRGRRRGGARKTESNNGQDASAEAAEAPAESTGGGAAPQGAASDAGSPAPKPRLVDGEQPATAGSEASGDAEPGAPKPRTRRKRGSRGGRRTRSGARSRKPAPEVDAPVKGAEAGGGGSGAAAAAAVAEPAPAEDPRPAPAPAPERPQRRGRVARRPRKGQVERTLVVNAAPQETRVGIMENGVLSEVFIEREGSRTVVGNIYKGRVSKVLPGMQSAFVSVGLERDAFLYVSDISPGYDAYEGLIDLDQVDGAEAIRESASKVDREAKIQDLIKEGQELLVQVTKEPIGTKGARITSYVTLPGRFLVLMPQVEHVGVSRKIGDARERSRLRRILDKVRVEGMGFIVRTVAEGCDAAELEADARYLISIWEDVRKKAEKASAPSQVHRELSVVPKLLRDLLNSSVSKVIIDQKRTYDEAVDLVGRLQPDMIERVQLYSEAYPIFEKYGVQPELDKALRSRIWLKSGGYIVINQTEALVAIDVNTGKFVGRRNLEETVLKTNLEAVSEIVRQLRLRDLGGIIVVDFIDMEERKSKKKLIEAFEKEIQKDRARTKVLQISDFGLVEITRQRTKKSLERILTRTCPYCTGAGKIKSPATVMFEIQRELMKLAANIEGKRIIVRANPEVAHQLQGEIPLLVEGVRALEPVDISVKADSTLHHEQFDILSL